MKKVNISALAPGMVTAEDVYDFNHRLILPKGLVLTDHTITKLELYSIISVKIEDQRAEMPKEDAIPADTSYSQRLKLTSEFQNFEVKYTTATSIFKAIVDDSLRHPDKLDTRQLIQNIETLLSTKDKHVNVFDMLHNMRQLADATYVHCMNVGIICNIFAHWLHMSPEDIETATLCGLLHDIGKLMIPNNIISKTGKLTDLEYRIMQTHPREGYEMLLTANVDEPIRNAAYMHHERCDGTGYPQHLTSDQIDPFAKLVAIADVYDAMTCARLYRGPMCPFKVIAALDDESLQKYDPHYILTFLKQIADTYLLQSVRLSNGEVGQIVFINPNKLSRPTIRVGDEYVDLSAQSDLYIDSVV